MKSNFGLAQFVRVRNQRDGVFRPAAAFAAAPSVVRRDLVQLLLGQIKEVVEKAKRDPNLDGDDGNVERRSVAVGIKLTCATEKGGGWVRERRR